MTLLVGAHGGASSNGRNFTNLLVRFRGGASIYMYPDNGVLESCWLLSHG